jgi:hypothetical protein
MGIFSNTQNKYDAMPKKPNQIPKSKQAAFAVHRMIQKI